MAKKQAIKKLQAKLSEKELVLLNTIELAVEALDTIDQLFDYNSDKARDMVRQLKESLEPFSVENLANAVDEEEFDEDEEEIDCDLEEMLKRIYKK